MNRAAAQASAAAAGPAATPVSGPLTERPSVPQLWLCLGLPHLPMEVRSGGCDDQDARVIVDRAGRVVQASAAAADSGVAPGLPLNAALALCPGLVTLARDAAAEQAALERLAAWAGAFTSLVSLAPPAALLLEVQGSLRLFGGLEALRLRICGALCATGHEGREAVAPTPLAALWLARAGHAEAVTDPAALAGRIGRLRPAVTGWPEATLATLRSLGVESLADCLRLPRDGFARRIGRGPLADLDRALGRLPDPRAAFRPPPHYRGALELAAETADTARLARALGGLFAELEGFLRARQRAVSRLAIRFFHLRRPATELALGLASPGLEAAHFDALLAERLERLVLPAPVISVALEAESGEPFDPALIGLFGDGPGAVAGLRLVERLRARLGRRRRARPGPLGRASAGARPGELRSPAQGLTGCHAVSLSGRTLCAARPGWLLATPRPLREPRRPALSAMARCSLESGPERLETGWWDGREISRDYWIARTSGRRAAVDLP
jgi:protein ImuB